MTYSLLLFAHSWLRWLVVALAVATVGRAVRGWVGRRSWSPLDDRLGRFFVIGLDGQVLLGVVLSLLVSPITTGAFHVPATIMTNAALRFWVVEHPFAMLAALALAHVGRARIRRATEAPARHRLAAVFFGLALFLLLVGIPWPFMPTARPLWRGW